MGHLDCRADEADDINSGLKTAPESSIHAVLPPVRCQCERELNFETCHERDRLEPSLRGDTLHYAVPLPVLFKSVQMPSHIGRILHPRNDVVEGRDTHYPQPPVLLNLLHSRQLPVTTLTPI